MYPTRCNSQLIGCVSVHRGIRRLADPKSAEWAGSHETWRQADDTYRVTVEFLLAWRGVNLLFYFVLFRPPTDWIRPIHSMEDSLLYSESIDLNVNVIQKHPHRNIQDNVWPNIWILWPSQVDTQNLLSHQVNITLLPDQPSLPHIFCYHSPKSCPFSSNLGHFSLFCWIKNTYSSNFYWIPTIPS